MKYYERIIQPEEIVKLIAQLHWMIYARAWLLIAGAVVAAILSQIDPSLEDPALISAVALLGWGLLLLLRAWLVRVTTEIVVTDRRIIYKVGLVARHTEEMNLSKVETVDVDQGLAGRILDYGSLLIRGTGGSWEPLRRVAAPLAVRNAIMVG
jgi:uncharacterized membrane protein YdbT with pleckstrin-like domain